MTQIKSKPAFGCQISGYSPKPQPARLDPRQTGRRDDGSATNARRVPAQRPCGRKAAFEEEDSMKASLAAGVASTVRHTVDRERTIGFMGENARVYATPMLVRDIEMASRELLLSHLDPGEDSVGTRIELDHLAATLEGMSVELTVTVTGVNGRAVTLEVSGRDDVDLICKGKHGRFVVDVKKTEERLAAKARKAGVAKA
jgi:fluoroacetyl-CoA thioesterase